PGPVPHDGPTRATPAAGGGGAGARETGRARRRARAQARRPAAGPWRRHQGTKNARQGSHQEEGRGVGSRPEPFFNCGDRARIRPAQPRSCPHVLDLQATRCGGAADARAGAGGEEVPQRRPVGACRRHLAAHVVNKVLEKVPELDHSEIEDLICGCGLPGGEQGHNIGRVVSILSRLDVPGVTVNRYCSSSLMTTRMAAHSIEAGEGDVFLSVGVECVSRYGSGYPDAPDTYNSKLVPGNSEEYPDVYISMGQTAENVARRERISREEQDRYAVKSQGAAVAARDNGFFDREIIPVPLPNGEMFTRDDGPRPGTTMEGLAALKPAFR